MVNCCTVSGCRNYSGMRPDLRLHRFPIESELYMKYWTRATHRPLWTPKKNSKICSDHFKKNDYMAPHFVKLKITAVPSLMLPSFCMCCKEIKEEPETYGSTVIIKETSISQGTQTTPMKRFTGPSPAQLGYKKQIRTLQKVLIRRKKKVSELQELLQKVQEERIKAIPDIIIIVHDT